ncbi:hypothetical protein VOLCADRAFT_120612 [Volvox carteri f. nagariensis]|uniref:Cyclic phosphodiesterase n=1 Tax=Volvox carteri f. nagariensis TaxID=3068 RepID=D8TPM1_VOLCA|nr:uncharacterized protein VOLCADRAFT_120612 [Volvox carteri f. nagariensis]EFJ50788.1 hypothetical protein VOLCADRAFT_120612 [Volvox carteri f. nagariensis]|eukprot:XP_002948381.1 hypothetical protein VOLCADRAFT_120612 [Volvox carteri f. nagariensis]
MLLVRSHFGSPSSHVRVPAPAPRNAGWGLLVSLALLLGLVLYWYGTALPQEGSQQRPSNHHNRQRQPYNYHLLPLQQLLISPFSSSHQRYLRHTASPLSVCRSSVMPSTAATAAGSSSSSSAPLKEYYSLWAMPKGKLGDQLRSEIAHLAQRYGGPAFPPHVTVLGDIEKSREEVQALAKELAAQVKKYRINFVEVTQGTFFYQNVFMLVAKDDGTMAAAAAARSVYGMTTPPYMPHLSLLYADMDDAEKAKVVEYETGRLYGESSGYDTLLVETGYEVDSFTLWYSPIEDRTTRSWCLVEEYPLTG